MEASMTNRKDVDEHANDKPALPKDDKDEDDMLARSKLGKAAPEGDVAGSSNEKAQSNSKLGKQGPAPKPDEPPGRAKGGR
jgi:hypothetical protein